MQLCGERQLRKTFTVGESDDETNELWRMIRSGANMDRDGAICTEFCELQVVERSIQQVHRVVEDKLIVSNVCEGEILHAGVLSDSIGVIALGTRKRRGFQRKSAGGGEAHHLRMLYLWEDVDRERAVCFDVFVRKMNDSTALGTIGCMQVCRERLLPRIWARVEIESKWMEIPAGLALGGYKGKKVVDAVGEGLGGSKLGVEPWLHGFGEAELGVVDHGEAGDFDVAVRDCIVDEAEHEGLEMFGGKEVAVFDHVALKVGAAGIDADALCEWDVDEHGEDQVVDTLDRDWGDFALLADPGGPRVGVA